MLRSGDFALYHNQEYELYENGDDTVNLVTDNPQSIEHGFIKDPFSNRFEKTVNVQEVTNAYHIKIYGKYKNAEVNVRTEDEHSYLIGTPDAEKAQILNLDRIDKYFYEKWVPKDEVEIFEVKKAIAL
jgi:hypothetical protein